MPLDLAKIRAVVDGLAARAPSAIEK
jgi:hypothetical protein